MSIIRKQKKEAVTSGAVKAKSLPLGDRVIDLLDIAYRTRRPVLLEGTTGIGKSDIVSQFAARGGIDVLVLDLSLLEPPDLVGLPIIEGGRTQYATPAGLPIEGRGVLMLEELNRAELPVMQPALQLLSARRLHDYELPEGWTCVAAINPEDGDYQVNRLDPALRSRFLQLAVHADREAWLKWATAANVHSLIQQVVESHDEALNEVPPRSWVYASDILYAMNTAEFADKDLVLDLLLGYLPPAWANIVVAAITSISRVPDFDLESMSTQDLDYLASWATESLKKGRTDAVVALANRLRHRLSTMDFRESVRSERVQLPILEQIAWMLPGDQRELVIDSIADTDTADEVLRLLEAGGADMLKSALLDCKATKDIGRDS